MRRKNAGLGPAHRGYRFPFTVGPGSRGTDVTPEITSIIAVGVVLAGVVLAGVVLVSVRENTRVLRAEMKDMRVGMAKLREWLARIEGMFEGFLRRDVEPAPAAAE